MSTGHYAAYLEIHKAVMKGDDGKFRPAKDYKAGLPIDAEILLDLRDGYVLEPISRSAAINDTKTGVKPCIGFRIRKITPNKEHSKPPVNDKPPIKDGLYNDYGLWEGLANLAKS